MSTKPMPVHGVDISSHQPGTLDMAGAKRRGLRWLYHKATEGATYRDPNYARRREEARRAGLPFGAYHFASPDGGDARKEARFFLSVAQPKPGDLRPVLDIEQMGKLRTMAEVRVWAATWIAEVVKATGVKPIVYTAWDLGSATKGCLLWRPRYNNANRDPELRWDIWQFSDGKYGVPNTLAGFGHVDLNTMRAGLTVDNMLIPKPKPKPKPTRVVDVMHASLQFSDTGPQHTADITKIFERARDRKVAWITGTESGPGAGNTTAELLRIGALAGYRMWVPSSQRKGKPGWATDAWIAVRHDLVTGRWDCGYIPVIPGSGQLYAEAHIDPKGKPKWGPKGLVHVGFDTKELGRIHVGASHYLTKARTPGSVVAGIDHWEWNKKLGTAIGQWAVEAGAGSDLAFYGGDQNMADNKNDQPQGDTFFGQPLTSAWDELKHWDGTGHGNIDVVASYDRDGRVSAEYCRALNDKAIQLNMDHFLVEAGFRIRVK